MITIGVDPHKAANTAVAIDESGGVRGEVRVPANKSTCRRLLTWAAAWKERTWAIEGANGLGRLLAQHLVASGERVVDVPATLAARARQLDSAHGRKTDGIDARTVAVVAQRRSDLRVVAREDHAEILRLLSGRRDELTAERRRVVNRLHRLLRDLRPGGAPTELSADTAARMLGTIRPHDAVCVERKAVARQLVADVRRLDRALADTAADVASRSEPPAPRSPGSLGSATCWRRRSSAIPATSVGSTRPTAWPATPAPPRSRSRAASSSATAWRAPATGR